MLLRATALKRIRTNTRRRISSLYRKDVYKRQELAREKKVQQAMLTIKKKFGKNAMLKGMNLSEGATAKDRNEQIGGHKA